MTSLTAVMGQIGGFSHFVAALLLCGSASSATNGSQFFVSATLVAIGAPNLPKSAFCQTTPALAFGALVTVVCSTGEAVNIETPVNVTLGAPIHGGAYRVILSRTFATGFELGLPGSYTSSPGYGMASSWRVIQIGDRNYYELLMGW